MLPTVTNSISSLRSHYNLAAMFYLNKTQEQYIISLIKMKKRCSSVMIGLFSYGKIIKFLHLKINPMLLQV